MMNSVYWYYFNLSVIFIVEGLSNIRNREKFPLLETYFQTIRCIFYVLCLFPVYSGLRARRHGLKRLFIFPDTVISSVAVYICLSSASAFTDLHPGIVVNLLANISSYGHLLLVCVWYELEDRTGGKNSIFCYFCLFSRSRILPIPLLCPLSF